MRHRRRTLWGTRICLSYPIGEKARIRGRFLKLVCFRPPQAGVSFTCNFTLAPPQRLPHRSR